LLGEFSRRGDNEDSDLSLWWGGLALEETVQGREQEGQGLASTSLGLDEAVTAPGREFGQNTMLDWGHELKFHDLESLKEFGV
jgi:hypothetical protein